MTEPLLHRTDQHPHATRRWAVVLPALLLPLSASFLYFVVFPGTAIGHAAYSSVKVFELLWPAIATLFILREPLRREPPGVIARRHSLLEGTLFGLAVVALMLLLKEFTFMGTLMEQSAGQVRQRVADMGMLNHYILAALAISIAHAALEEWYWRWFVFGNLRHLLRERTAHVIAATGFAAHHLVVTSQFFPFGLALFLSVSVGIGGAFWSWQYQRHRTLLGPWFGHMIVDFGIFWVGYGLLFSR